MVEDDPGQARRRGAAAVAATTAGAVATDRDGDAGLPAGVASAAAAEADAAVPVVDLGDPGDRREPVDVAVGILTGADGRFLMTSRPAGKVCAGQWEFPGGKVEPGESVEQALRRELHEELGIVIGPARRWRVALVGYAHARVRLHVCRVRQWDGELRMRESQSMAWQRLPVTVAPVLAGTRPLLAWLAQEAGHGSGPVAAAPPIDSARMDWLDEIRWDADGLVPAIAQEVGSGDVLMVAWMNRDALAATAARGEAVYWSRSRGRLWHKGEASGHVQRVHGLRLDCDGDVVLLDVEQLGHAPGIACHTGRHRCFFRRLDGRGADAGWRVDEPVLRDPAEIYR